MKTVKADIRLKKKIEVSIQPSATITKLTFSPRIYDGQLVFDITLPDGSAIMHLPKVLTPPPAKA